MKHLKQARERYAKQAVPYDRTHTIALQKFADTMSNAGLDYVYWGINLPVDNITSDILMTFRSSLLR